MGKKFQLPKPPEEIFAHVLPRKRKCPANILASTKPPEEIFAHVLPEGEKVGVKRWVDGRWVIFLCECSLSEHRKNLRTPTFHHILGAGI